MGVEGKIVISCDYEGCTNTIETTDKDVAHNQGWRFNQGLIKHDGVLCPEHAVVNEEKNTVKLLRELADKIENKKVTLQNRDYFREFPNYFKLIVEVTIN